ncbi:hypothetical protein [Oleomonas cavernae]|uniref:hypothetical protein n=1 Tax=Oleomonas cavernae TaxID=2320859 RepID=UPI0013148CF3|nr:hypothetical protein [Oleomonas cavernae]
MASALPGVASATMRSVTPPSSSDSQRLPRALSIAVTTRSLRPDRRTAACAISSML